MARYHLYLGTYTQKGGTGIEHYAFDSKTGGFALLDATPRRAFSRAYPHIPLNRATLDDIMVFYGKGEM